VASVELLILTKENCGFCEDAKAIASRLTLEYDLTITTLELNSDEGRELAVRGGVMFPPGIFVEGEPFSYGRPSERALRRELDRRLQWKSAEKSADR
jgi:glutaredoxin